MKGQGGSSCAGQDKFRESPHSGSSTCCLAGSVINIGGLPCTRS